MTAVGGTLGVEVGRVAVSPMTTTAFRSRSIFTVAMVSLPVSTPPHAIWCPEISGYAPKVTWLFRVYPPSELGIGYTLTSPLATGITI